ncbi:MAG: glycosyltransferase family 2 protein [Planctomycetota bacterium]
MNDSAPDITMIVPTWNRSGVLKEMLDSCCKFDVSNGLTWELIVVDNNSTDDTREVAESYQDRLPVRVVHEPQQGVSRARNAGFKAALGELIVCTDDDVVLDPNWLQAYRKASHDYPDSMYFGGKIETRFIGDPPEWATTGDPFFNAMLVRFDLGPEPRRLSDKEQPFGPNMAIRRRAFREGARFNENLGRVGTSHVRGCETSIFLELQERGDTGYWIPDAWVGHRVPMENCNLRYLWKFYYGQGQTLMRLGMWKHGTSWRVTWRYLRRAITGALLRRPGWQIQFGNWALHLGVEKEQRRIRREGGN